MRNACAKFCALLAIFLFAIAAAAQPMRCDVCKSYNAPPIAHAGPDQTTGVGATVRLSGAESTDPDGLAEAWFPGGPDDPNLLLLRITMASAEHWEPPSGKVLQFLEIAAAAITHKPPAHDDVYRKLDF